LVIAGAALTVVTGAGLYLFRKHFQEFISTNRMLFNCMTIKEQIDKLSPEQVQDMGRLQIALLRSLGITDACVFKKELDGVWDYTVSDEEMPIVLQGEAMFIQREQLQISGTRKYTKMGDYESTDHFEWASKWTSYINDSTLLFEYEMIHRGRLVKAYVELNIGEDPVREMRGKWIQFAPEMRMANLYGIKK
jgi:hypothetical protein